MNIEQEAKQKWRYYPGCDDIIPFDSIDLCKSVEDTNFELHWTVWQVWGEAARPTAESDRNACANLT